MSFDQAGLDDLADRYNGVWSSIISENIADPHVDNSQISINRNELSAGQDGRTAVAAGFGADILDLLLQNDGIRSAGKHAVFMWTFTGHDAQTNNPLNITG